MNWYEAVATSDPQKGLAAGVYKASIDKRTIWLNYKGTPTTEGVFSLNVAWEGDQPKGSAVFSVNNKQYREEIASFSSITTYATERKPNWVSDVGSSSSSGSSATSGRSSPKPQAMPSSSDDGETQGSAASPEEDAQPPRRKSAPESEIPDRILVATIQVLGARISDPDELKIKIVGDEDDEEGGSIALRLRKTPAEDKTSVVIGIKTNESNAKFFQNFAGEYVNVVITAASAATGGKMTLTKEFKVPKRIVSDSSYLLQFNFSEGGIRAKDATQGLKAEFGARGAINFNKQPGTVQYIYYTREGDLKADMVETSVTASGKTYEFFFDNEPLLVPVKIPENSIRSGKKESHRSSANLLKEADSPQEHWILLLGKTQGGGGAVPSGAPDKGDTAQDRGGVDDDTGGGSPLVNANVALRYVKFTTQDKYVILPNYTLDLAGSAFALATNADAAPGDKSERTLVKGMVDEDDIKEAVYNALFKTSPEYKQMSGQFSDNLSPTAARSIVKCWVEGPTVTGYRGVTAREESRYRG